MVAALDETSSELKDIVAQDLPAAFQLLKEMNDSVNQVSQLVDSMLAKVKRGEMSTDKGLSFLEVKYQMLLSYLINQAYIVLRKCSGKKIEGDPAIDRLVEIRTVLEKMRPIEHKLKYQIDKMMKTASTGATNQSDPSQLRANPENMTSKLNDSDESGSESGSEDQQSKKEENKSTGVYVPPKLAAVHYDGDESKNDRQARLVDRARKRALSSSVVQELREEYLDTPLEVTDMSASKAVLSRQRQNREEYEEQYFTRLPLTKQDKIRSRQVTTVGSLGDEVTRFSDLSALAGGSGTAKKRKAGKGKGKPKKGNKKRKYH